MAPGSDSQWHSLLRVDSLWPEHRTSPEPSNTPMPNRSSPVECGSTPVPASVSVGISPEQSTTGSLLEAELTRLKYVLKKEVRLNGLPQVQFVVRRLETCLDHLVIREQNQHEYEELISGLTNLIPLLWKPFIDSNPQNIPQVIIETVESIENQVQGIEDSQSHWPTIQMSAEEGKERFILKCFREVRNQFTELRTEIGAWGTQREQWTDARLRDLLPTHEAYYNAAVSATVTKRVGCTENTRVDLLNDAQTWTQDKNGAKIFWLNGMAGTGKTTIAYTMCKWLEEDKRLAASFFCSRNSLGCRDVNKIVPTIAYQLGQRGRYPDLYRHRLCTAFEEDMDIARRDISAQFENLISKPLLSLGEAIPNSVVVVIDALDECTGAHEAGMVLTMLLQHGENLPIKFFVTSRPEPTITQRMTASGGAMRSIMWLHDIDRSLVQADIRTYLAEALRSVQATPSELNALVGRSGCLFIFAATAVRYIIPERGSVNHRQRLQTVLKIRPRQGNKSYKDIDDLYTTILSNALDAEVFEEEELVLRRQVLWAVACASGPLTMSAIAKLLNLPDTETVEVAIQPLQSVLRVSEDDNMVSTLHASFADFLLSKERAGKLYCSEGLQNAHLAECCFRIMNRSLQFNICRLESSYMLDRDVPDLEKRVERVISNELFYACRYWGDHLAKSPSSSLLVDLLGFFMEHHFLFWIEVLNLKKHVGHGDGVLGQALAWLLPEEGPTDLQDFIHDARNFFTIFASSPTSLSTPHVYISALPFTPKKSRIWATYWPRTQGLIWVESEKIEARGKSALATWVVGDPVNDISISSDGKRIASGSSSVAGSRGQNSANISIWEGSSGTCTIGPLQGHVAKVLSVSFSPDDTHVASGSADQTIRIWDASDGHMIAGPLHGHTGRVNSISFSLDGIFLASGSDDHTIRMWDASSGTQIGEPLNGHRGGVMTVVFSPDGEHLASGSSDCLVRVWDLRTYRSIGGPFKGHTRSVNSVAYSPDALHLVSGSDDQTVRVWHVLEGILLAGPFVGHASAVSSVSFSPDGDLVVSGSHDKTVRVWEVGSGKLIAEPFEGHTDQVHSVLFAVDGTRILSSSEDSTIRVWDARHRTTGVTDSLGHKGGINSVALSPNGTRAASGSFDRTIFVWDTQNGALVAGPFEGHTRSISSVSFSPDGARIVSGSWDCTLRIWEASTSALLAGPFEGHTDWVMAVTFSPDGDYAVSGSHDGTIRMWDSYTGEPVSKPFNVHSIGTNSIAFSPDGTRLVSGSYDCAVRMWDPNDSIEPLWESYYHHWAVYCVAFSPDGTRVVSGSHDCTIWVLDADSGAVVHGPFMGHSDWVRSVSFSPDGTRVVSGSRDNTVRVWDLQSGTVVAGPLEGYTDEVKSVVFSPNGAHVISGSADGSIRLWDLAVATQPGSISHHTLSMNSDGWLTNEISQQLLWVPSDLREEFPLHSLSNFITIGNECSVFIDNSTLFIGDNWDKCYCSAPTSSV